MADPDSNDEFRPAAPFQTVADPVPTRPFGSVRRTSHIDIHPHEDGLNIQGVARDLRTTAVGHSEVLAEGRLEAVLDVKNHIRSIETHPSTAATTALLGRAVVSGFRAAAAEALSRDDLTGSPLALLCDDLPVAALISGYARLNAGTIDGIAAAAMVETDVCAGWRADGSTVIALSRGHGLQPTLGPRASSLDRPDDSLAWHRIGRLREGAMRRQRLVEITDDNPGVVWAMFRDSHAGRHGEVSVVHEYVVEATVDPTTRRVLSCVATPKVLPLPECPEAVASARRIEGQLVGELREFVRSTLVGTTTCTHLNDLLRSLADLDLLMNTLAHVRPNLT